MMSKQKKLTLSDETPKTPGERIKYLRKLYGLTQDKLAERAGYTNKTSIAQYETGERPVTKRAAGKIASALQVLPEYIMGDTPYRTEIERSEAELAQYFKFFEQQCNSFPESDSIDDTVILYHLLSNSRRIMTCMRRLSALQDPPTYDLFIYERYRLVDRFRDEEDERKRIRRVRHLNASDQKRLVEDMLQYALYLLSTGEYGTLEEPDTVVDNGGFWATSDYDDKGNLTLTNIIPINIEILAKIKELKKQRENAQKEQEEGK